jgi:hypothetical protein
MMALPPYGKGMHMQNSFDPWDVTLLAKVVDEACRKLGRPDIETRELLAARVVSHAALGERDHATLLAVAMNGKGFAHAY